MFKRIASLVLCTALVMTMAPIVSMVGDAVTASAAAANLVPVPDNDGVTNNTSYILGEGTDAEVEVICDFRASGTAPTDSITPKYITIHNTGTYVSTATAYNVHKNTNKTSSQMAWHYTVGTEIYQGLQDTRWGWHVGKSYSGVPANSNSIGIEICVDSFPQTVAYGESGYSAFDNEDWDNGEAIMEWYENKFDQYLKNAAMLALVLCERWDLDWQTAIVTHYDAKSYQEGAAGKDCPMQMRATYDASTGKFTEAGSYVNGRDGYFWQIFWSYVEAYAAGAKSVGVGTTAEKLGTYQVTPSDGLNVRAGAGTSYDKVGVLEQGDVVKVTELSGNWGKVTLEDGTEGWCNITDYGRYIGVDALAYSTGTNSGGLQYGYDSNGRLILTNTSSQQGQFDLYTPLDIGTLTTPYMNVKMTPLSGEGYYFGITQYASGYFMMRDCQSGDELVYEDSAPYMTNTETLQIDISQWWTPEERYRINQVRLYVAPNSSIRVDYFYFAAASDVVTDTTYNLLAKNTNVNLMQPDTLTILSTSKSGSYVYSNGMLTVTADTEDGFDVAFNVNETFDIATMTRLLVSIEANTPFDVALRVTNKNGEGWVTLKDDFHPFFTESYPTSGYLPAWTGSAGLDLYNYYVYNDVVPTDGMSTITQVKISLGGAGTSYFNSIQIAANDAPTWFADGVYKSDSTNGALVLDSDVYTVSGGVVSDVTVGATAADLVANVTSSYTVAVYESGEAITATAALKSGQTVKVLKGEIELASYSLAVRGDVNGDGAVNTADARLALSATLDSIALNDWQTQAADYNDSEDVSTSDVRAILSAVVA